MNTFTKREFYKKHLKGDISAGLVVFLIALPLCLGISLASGAPLFSGIIAGIIGGLIVGFLSGSQVNVSGPAASVALVIFNAIITLGSFEAVLLATILAGVYQIILGFLRAGTIAYFFPSSMIKGILASIGLILILKQIPHALGYDAEFEGSQSFSQSDGHNTFSELIYMLDGITWGALIIALMSLAIILIWDSEPVKSRLGVFKYLPSALIAVMASILLNEYFITIDSWFALSSEHLVKLPVLGAPSEFLSLFTTPDFSQITNPEIYTIALSIAFIASLETLLSTEAGDKLDPYKRRTSTNRELKAQGIGNIVAGMIGGLPITAVIVRTSANISSGGRTKIGTITHGFLMLVFVVLVPTLLNKIPLASLAAILFVVGYKLTSIKLFKKMFASGKRQFAPFVITIIAVLFSDLITGIIIGGTVSAFIILRDNYKMPFFVEEKNHHEGESIILKLATEVTFLNKASVLLTLDHVAENSKVVIDASGSNNIDMDVLEIFEEFEENAKMKNVTVEKIGLERFYK